MPPRLETCTHSPSSACANVFASSMLCIYILVQVFAAGLNPRGSQGQLPRVTR